MDVDENTVSKNAEIKNLKKQGSSVVLTLFHRAMPVAGLAIALIATVAWIGLLGYVAIKLF